MERRLIELSPIERERFLRQLQEDSMPPDINESSES